jgi:integrase
LNQVREAWSRIIKRAGLEDFHLHGLRHVALTNIRQDRTHPAVTFDG